MTPADLRQIMFDNLQEDQGQGFVSDSDDHCSTFDELAEYADQIALRMTRAARISRRIAATARNLAKRATSP